MYPPGCEDAITALLRSIIGCCGDSTTVMQRGNSDVVAAVAMAAAAAVVKKEEAVFSTVPSVRPRAGRKRRRLFGAGR